MNRSDVVVLAAALLIAGCVTEPKIVSVAPPSAQLREQLRTVGLVVTASHEALDLPTPPGRGEAAAMMAGSALGGFAEGGVSGDPVGLAFVMAIAIAAAPFLAIYGAAAAHSEEELEQARASLTTALEATDIAALVGERAGSQAMTLARRELVDTDSSPHPLAGARAAVDHHLELQVHDPLFAASGRIDPELTLLLVVRGQVRRESDGSCAYGRTWLYRGHARNYFDLAADDAALLRAEIRTAADRTAAKIVDDIFLSTQSEPRAELQALDRAAWDLRRLKKETEPGTVVTIPTPSSTAGAAASCTPANLDDRK